MMLTRTGWLTALCAAVVTIVVAPSAPQAWSQAVGPDFPAALVGVTQLVLLAVAGWVLLVLLGALAHVRLPGLPRTLRSALIVPAAVGALSVVVVAAPAQADQRHDLAGLPLPDRPTTSAPLEETVPAAGHAPTSTVTVRAGDTLWSIAAKQLPADASTARITGAWHAWYETNRAVIGTDPHLIQPGQVFTAPDTALTEQDAP